MQAKTTLAIDMDNVLFLRVSSESDVALARAPCEHWRMQSRQTIQEASRHLFTDVDIACHAYDLEALAALDQSFFDQLDEDEKARAAALVCKQDQVRFIRAHGVLRIVLGEATNTPPETLVFAYNPHGKPQLNMPRPPHFSLSASADIAVIAISADHLVGVDVELIEPRSVEAMLPMVGHEADQQILDLAAPEGLLAFYRLWTGKEAILKAIGAGFQENPREINLGMDFLTGSEKATRIKVFGQSFDLYCQQADTAMIALALIIDNPDA